MDGSGDHNGRQQRDRDGQRRRDWTAADGRLHKMIGGGAMDSSMINGQRWQRRRQMDGGSNKMLLNLEVLHGIGIASIFGEKRPILCVTEKKHQKSNPHTNSGTPQIDFQIRESQNRYGVHSNLGTNAYTSYMVPLMTGMIALPCRPCWGPRQLIAGDY